MTNIWRSICQKVEGGQKPKLRLSTLIHAPPRGFVAISACASAFLGLTDHLAAAGSGDLARQFTLVTFAPSFYFELLRLTMGLGGKGKKAF